MKNNLLKRKKVQLCFQSLSSKKNPPSVRINNMRKIIDKSRQKMRTKKRHSSLLGNSVNGSVFPFRTRQKQNKFFSKNLVYKRENKEYRFDRLFSQKKRVSQIATLDSNILSSTTRKAKLPPSLEIRHRKSMFTSCIHNTLPNPSLKNNSNRKKRRTTNYDKLKKIVSKNNKTYTANPTRDRPAPRPTAFTPRCSISDRLRSINLRKANLHKLFKTVFKGSVELVDSIDTEFGGLTQAGRGSFSVVYNVSSNQKFDNHVIKKISLKFFSLPHFLRQFMVASRQAKPSQA